MGKTEYLRFLVAMHSDPALRAALQHASRALYTLDDLAAFAERHGFRFEAADIPLHRPAAPSEPR